MIRVDRFTPTDRETILEARGIVKNFPGQRALDRVDFDVRLGEVHGLVGEDGAALLFGRGRGLFRCCITQRDRLNLRTKRKGKGYGGQNC